MSPGEELLAAAQLLREKAKPILGGDMESAWHDFWADHGADFGLISEDEEWIALFGPALAEPLAAWLEAVASGWEKSTALAPGGSDVRFAAHPALAVARVINGGAR